MPVRGGAVLQRKCACGGSAGITGECEACTSKKLLGQRLQRKLAISEPGDQYEQEADRVAEQVMRMSEGQSVVPLRESIRTSGDAVARSPILQRAEEGISTSAAEGEKPKEEGSRCPSWRGDPQSITKRAGEFYARHHLTPPSQATVERIECEPPIANGNYGCYVHFSDGLVLRVIVRDTDIVVGTGPGPITTEHPPPATPLCWYEYSCPEGDLVLTVKKCQSSKPSGSSSPPAVAQRAATSGARGPMTAPPIVHDVLNSPGQPLDAATRSFFESRFGHDFSRVRVHTDEWAAESAHTVTAMAYTVGRDMVFGSGQYAPQRTAGRHLIAHELAHVVQQHAGATGGLAMSGPGQPSVTPTTPAIHRRAAPYIKKVTVHLTPPQSADLEWKGTPPADAPGSDSFTVSTGKGYGDPGDPPGTCLRDCCSDATTQCASPWTKPSKVGACCTYVGNNFWTGTPKEEHNGWKWWTPIQPFYSKRGIALHEHFEVAGKPIGHGCVRMDEPNAKRIYDYSNGKRTNVTIEGDASPVACETDRKCATKPTTDKQGSRQDTDTGERFATLAVSGLEGEMT